jgi:CHASE2 domain-containing sensor protein
VTYLLRAVDFAPLTALVSFEDFVYSKVIPPVLDLNSDAHTVILVDIDDAAIARWGIPTVPGDATPRSMLAQLTAVLRDAHAAVIFLDFDLRNRLPGDDKLQAELARSSPTPVILPIFLKSGARLPCERQMAASPPLEFQTAFDRRNDPHSVVSAHAIVTIGAYGVIEGTCSSYRVRLEDNGEIVSREAAMLRAVDLARMQSGQHATQPANNSRPHSIPIHWRILPDTELLRDQTGRLAYARIKASLLERNGDIDTRGVDLSAIQGAIVIVGATHQGADDLHSTPAGELPGALVHANLGLDLQSVSLRSVPLTVQFLIDIALGISSALLTFRLCLLPFYKSVQPGAIRSRDMLCRLVRETVVIVCFGVFSALVILGLALEFGDFLAGWRFAVLSFMLGTAVVTLINFVVLVSDATAELAEAATARFSPRLLHPGASSATLDKSDSKGGP